MKLSYKTVLIVNPRSANGATGRRWPAIEKTLENEFQETLDVVFTQSPLHATELTRVHLEKRYEMVVALGGDGLINEVVNGFFERDQNLFPHAVMGIISLGTASDFVRTMGWGRGLSGSAQRLGGTRTHAIDVGKASFQNFKDERKARYFLNVADFGSGGAVVERVNRTSKAFGGTISFLWGILSTLPRYKNKEIRFTIDRGPEKRRIINNLIIANGQYYGGGIRSAPDAAVDDGLFQFVTIGDLTFPEVVWNLPRFRRGTYLTHPKVDSYVGRRLSAGCDEPVLIELDGELVGTLPAEFEILPRALQVKVPDLTES
jgi:YegS/Rv2252/BmrU family lipid kinase